MKEITKICKNCKKSFTFVSTGLVETVNRKYCGKECYKKSADNIKNKDIKATQAYKEKRESLKRNPGYRWGFKLSAREYKRAVRNSK